MAEQLSSDAVAAACAALPEVESATSHGVPVRKACAKRFATCCNLNHRGDGRLGLLREPSSGTQQRLVWSDPATCQVAAFETCSRRPPVRADGMSARL